MRITNNITAMNTYRQYSVNNSNVAKATQRLSSGYRINSAADDAAGLAISEKMRAQIRGLNMASKNSEDAISLVQTAEGALEETQSILQRMRELATQSSSDTNQDLVDRDALDDEFQQLKAEIGDISDKTTFNNMKLLDGNFGTKVNTAAATSTIFQVAGVVSVSASGAANSTYTFTDDGTDLTVTSSTGKSVTIKGGTMAAGAQTLSIAEFGITVQTNDGFAAKGLTTRVIAMGGSAGGKIQTGANANETMDISINDMSATGLAINTNDVKTHDKAETALAAVNTAINTVSSQRSKLGAFENRLEHKINNLNTSSENLSAAESRIRDVDMAQEMTEYTKDNILVQAATAMLSQANSAPQGVLKLLQ